MELGAIFLILALLILISMFLYTPFMARTRRGVTSESQESSALMAERDRVINSLQELDFDFKLGKIPAEDYPAQRSALLEKGAEILKKLDELSPALPSAVEVIRSGGTVEARIEKAVAERRADASVEVPELSDDDLESLIAARRKEHKDKSAGFCPKCGKPALVSDRFCPACGKSLN